MLISKQKESRAENRNTDLDRPSIKNNIVLDSNSWCLQEFWVCKEFIFPANKICLPMSVSPYKSGIDPPHEK